VEKEGKKKEEGPGGHAGFFLILYFFTFFVVGFGIRRGRKGSGREKNARFGAARCVVMASTIASGREEGGKMITRKKEKGKGRPLPSSSNFLESGTVESTGGGGGVLSGGRKKRKERGRKGGKVSPRRTIPY